MNHITEEELYSDQCRLPAREDLLDYLFVHTGKMIPFVPICEGHDAPAEFVDHIVYGKGGVCAIACRSGSKTTQIGMGMGMLAYHKGAPCRALGGSGQQSAAAYEEFRDFLYHGFITEVQGDILQSRTRFSNGGSVELLVQSSTSVRSPHVPIVMLDELDEFNPKILKAAKFIAQSMPGIPRKLIEASTRHVPMGLMSQEWDMFNGLKLIWCLLEVMEACNGDYKCSTCNLAASCPGKKKMGVKNKGDSGYYTIDDARELRGDVHDDESWDAEALCGEPRTEGSVYRMLDERKHMPGKVAFDPHLAVHRSFDYGAGDSPMVCHWWQMAEYKGRMQARKIDEMRWIGIADRLVVDGMLEHEKKMGYSNWIEMTFVPHDGKSLSNEMETRGILVTLPDQDVSVGNATVRNLLTPDKNGIVGLVMDKETTNATNVKGCWPTWLELKGYKMEKGRIIKINDHGPDAIRYFCNSMTELRVASAPPVATLPANVDVDP